jgi:heptosyltransferase-2
MDILVRGPNWTGDVVMATPGFRALRAGFPEARITLHLRESQLPLVAGAPWFDDVVPLRARGALAPLREGLSLRRGRRFDLGLCLPDSFSSALLMRAAGVGEVVGYARGARSLLLHRAVPLPDAGRAARGGPLLPRELHVLGLVQAVGCPARGTALELFVTAEEEEECERALAAAGSDSRAPLAALAPGASFGPSKQWPPAHFARAGDALAAAGARVALLGAPSERALTAAVAAAMRAPALDLAGRISLGATKALVRRARVVVCNDAGARHLAAAFGVACVVLLGPTSLEKTALNLERTTVLHEDVPCRPCYLRECPIDHRCLVRIGPERAVAAALPALVGSDRGAPQDGPAGSAPRPLGATRGAA